MSLYLSVSVFLSLFLALSQAGSGGWIDATALKKVLVAELGRAKAVQGGAGFLVFGRKQTHGELAFAAAIKAQSGQVIGPGMQVTIKGAGVMRLSLSLFFCVAFSLSLFISVAIYPYLSHKPV